jgi:putative FmdB family regulatory protein
MPLYRYACRNCTHTFEELVLGRAADGSQPECPECHGCDVERLLTTPARPPAPSRSLPMNCQGNGPPSGAPWCRRQ